MSETRPVDHAARMQALFDEHVAGGRLSAPYYDDDDVAAVLDELERLRNAPVPLPILRQVWRNGWMDHGNAMRQSAADADRLRADYERAFARYMSEDPAEADKDPYRPLDGPDDPAAGGDDEQAQAGRAACASCGRDFSLPYVTRQPGTGRCEDCVTTSWNREAERDGDVRAVAAFLAEVETHAVPQHPKPIGAAQ